MWLLDTSDIQLKAFSGALAESYVILSHTWGADEITFQDMQCPDETVTQKAGYKKVKSFCEWAQARTITYAWVDTCCIDKTSSAELSEAINSMFHWYRNSIICVVYLSDVPTANQADSSSTDLQQRKLLESRWFTRGLTLQELVAPKERVFLAEDWSFIDDSLWNEGILDVVSQITSIRPDVLNRLSELWDTCIAERMSWAARRDTTRPEDRAYSLMGIFQVNMPILYGEGLYGAFRRLQHEIMKTSFDQTLFAWRDHQKSSGLLADSPLSFKDTPELGLWAPNMIAPTTATNIGILIRPCIFQHASASIIQAALQCDVMTDEGWMCLLLHLKRVNDAVCVVSGKRHRAYRRVSCDTWYTISSDDLQTNNRFEDILVLENDNYDLVVNAQRQHDARWSDGAFGQTPMALRIGPET
jgi:hypothetical protein